MGIVLPGNEDYWNLLLALNCIPALISLSVWCLVPESPRYLFVIKGEEALAIKGVPISHFALLQFLRNFLLVVATFRAFPLERRPGLGIGPGDWIVATRGIVQQGQRFQRMDFESHLGQKKYSLAFPLCHCDAHRQSAVGDQRGFLLLHRHFPISRPGQTASRVSWRVIKLMQSINFDVFTLLDLPCWVRDSQIYWWPHQWPTLLAVSDGVRSCWSAQSEWGKAFSWNQTNKTKHFPIVLAQCFPRHSGRIHLLRRKILFQSFVVINSLYNAQIDFSRVRPVGSPTVALPPFSSTSSFSGSGSHPCPFSFPLVFQSDAN